MIVLIPARGGSKGVPRKNVRPLAGRPAIAWTIEASLKAGRVERVIVSTEDEEIAEAAQSAGAEVPFMRPAELATDTCPNGYACLHAIDYLAAVEGQRHESFALVQATSPLITPEEIDGAINLFEKRSADAVVAVSPIEAPVESICEIADDGAFVSVLRDRYGVNFQAGRRQTFGRRYAICGAITVLRTALMRLDVNYFWGSNKALAFPLSEEAGVDIDSPISFHFAEFLLRRRYGNTSNGASDS